MTRFVLDASVIVDHLRGRTDSIEFIASLQTRPLLSVISVAELRAGVRRASEEQMLSNFALSCELVPVNLEIAEHAGAFLRRFQPKYGLGIADAIVAATAETAGAQVATLNVRHFPMFPDLLRPY